jgi:hypothetical protein
MLQVQLHFFRWWNPFDIFDKILSLKYIPGCCMYAFIYFRSMGIEEEGSTIHTIMGK